MSSLAEGLVELRNDITDYLHVGYARWHRLIKRTQQQEREPPGDFGDEQVWTFLVGCGYAVAGEQGVAELTRLLTGSNQREPAAPKIWFEVLPIQPRTGEGRTRLDLALGTCARRKRTKSGIELGNEKPSWICFCEMKWHSDISPGVTRDLHRNQLARVIENALCFQGAGRYADRVHVALVTPSVFRHSPPGSRLYQYKFDEYESDRAQLARDINSCTLRENSRQGWSYPSDLARRIGTLSLLWVSYDELFEQLPDSPLAAPLTRFWREYGNNQGRVLAA